MTLPLTDHLNPSNYFGLFHIGPSLGGDARTASRASNERPREPVFDLAQAPLDLILAAIT
jgi:hypothetical protein